VSKIKIRADLGLCALAPVSCYLHLAKPLFSSFFLERSVLFLGCSTCSPIREGPPNSSEEIPCHGFTPSVLFPNFLLLLNWFIYPLLLFEAICRTCPGENQKEVNESRYFFSLLKDRSAQIGVFSVRRPLPPLPASPFRKLTIDSFPFSISFSIP